MYCSTFPQEKLTISMIDLIHWHKKIAYEYSTHTFGESLQVKWIHLVHKSWLHTRKYTAITYLGYTELLQGINTSGNQNT